jgi:predicted TIM-barrel fold metal-dependent hydrolase
MLTLRALLLRAVLAAPFIHLAHSLPAAGQGLRSPIIDVHLHSDWWDPGALQEPGNPPHATDAADLRRKTLAALQRYNIVHAVTDGGETEHWAAEAPGRIITAWGFQGPEVPIDSVRRWFTSGRYRVMAESGPQYAGLAPTDSLLEPYFALAEELNIPVGIHMGLGPPGAAYCCAPKYRMSLSNPLLLEDVLVRHPRLRLYVMHAGWPMADEMVGLLYAHPQVYVDIGVIDWYRPRSEFHTYLKRLIDAGFGKRVMFGSDQMIWPDAIGRAVAAVESASFLTLEQKRDIFFNNAFRFLHLAEDKRPNP